jgi:glucosamine kinase
LTQHLFVGVDGGATKTRVRVEDEAGCLLSEAEAGPANIRLSVAEAWDSIHAALQKACSSFNLSSHQRPVFHVGMGLAGCEVAAAYQAFLNAPHPFATLVLVSDAYTACLGAHGGGEGAIIIAGTGVVGCQIQDEHISKVSGYGFPHDDEGGGAWLGLEAVKLALQGLDGRLPLSDLARAVSLHLGLDLADLVEWANLANATAFASLAPLVIAQAQAGESNAIGLLQQAGHAIDRIGHALYAAQLPATPPLPCVMVGGIAPFLQPYLGEVLRSRLRPCLQTPDAGAILLVRRHLTHAKESHA